MALKLIKAGRCPVCRSADGFQERFQLEKFSVYECRCGIKFIDPSLDEESMIHIYQSTERLKGINPVLERYYEYATLSPNSKTFKDYTKALNELAQLTQKRNLLEVGCGRGSFIKVAQDQGWQVTGIDSSPENIKAVREEGMNGIRIDFLNYRPSQTYDVAVLWDLIEHPQEPRKFVEKSFELLSSNGLLLIATPNDPSLLSQMASWIYRLSGGKIDGPLRKFYVLEHTSYFNEKTLGVLLSQHHFEVRSLWKTETDIDRYQLSTWTKIAVKMSFWFARILKLENRLILIAQKKG